ncbi:MAG: hypothetical protein QW728_07995 [Thermoplasmata archaeon]
MRKTAPEAKKKLLLTPEDIFSTSDSAVSLFEDYEEIDHNNKIIPRGLGRGSTKALIAFIGLAAVILLLPIRYFLSGFSIYFAILLIIIASMKAPKKKKYAAGVILSIISVCSLMLSPYWASLFSTHTLPESKDYVKVPDDLMSSQEFSGWDKSILYEEEFPLGHGTVVIYTNPDTVFNQNYTTRFALISFTRPAGGIRYEGTENNSVLNISLESLFADALNNLHLAFTLYEEKKLGEWLGQNITSSNNYMYAFAVVSVEVSSSDNGPGQGTTKDFLDITLETTLFTRTETSILEQCRAMAASLE